MGIEDLFEDFKIRNWDNPINHGIAWTPGLFLYAAIKEDNRANVSQIRRIVFYSRDVGVEILLNLMRIGTLYSAYKTISYIDQTVQYILLQ